VFVLSLSLPLSLAALSPTAPEESSSSDDPLFTEPVAPTLSLGERVAWIKSSGPEFGNVKWIGRMPQITNDWTVGIEFVSHLCSLSFSLCSLSSLISNQLFPPPGTGQRYRRGRRSFRRPQIFRGQRELCQIPAPLGPDQGGQLRRPTTFR